MNDASSLVGRFVQFRYGHLLETITFRARIVRETDDSVTVRVPDRVRAIPFPPGGRQSDGLGPRLLRYSRDTAMRALVV